MKYEYVLEDRLETPHKYGYAPWGPELMAAWRASRAEHLAAFGPPPASLPDALAALRPASPTAELLRGVALDALRGGEDDAGLAPFVRKFEVTKRLYASYEGGTGRRSSDDFRSPEPYLLLAIACLARASRGGAVQALNAALKLCDTICSIGPSLLATTHRELASASLAMEAAAVAALFRAKGEAP